MNQMIVTLLSKKPCELNRFIMKYSDQNMNAEERSFRWSCEYHRSLETSLILATLIDNEENYQIEAYLSINHQENIHVTQNNIETILKHLLLLDTNHFHD